MFRGIALRSLIAARDADIARKGGRTYGAAATLRTQLGVYTALSGSVDMHPELLPILMGQRGDATKPLWLGGCAEIGCISQALWQEDSLKGATIYTINIGSGSGKAPCSSCHDLLKYLQIENIGRPYRGGQ